MDNHFGQNASIVFDGLPIPPTSNMQYAIVFRPTGRQFVPKKELVQYKKAMADYFLRNHVAIKHAREVLGGGKALSVQAFFAFERSRLFTKKGNFKRLDVSNRLKALHDCLAKALLLDDSCFVHIGAAKYPVDTKDEEHCCVNISVVDMEEEGEEPPPSVA